MMDKNGSGFDRKRQATLSGIIVNHQVLAALERME
jgi:hypothetical protein